MSSPDERVTRDRRDTRLREPASIAGPAAPMSSAPVVGMPGAPTTSAEGLAQRISEMEKRLQESPQDNGAAVLLADALLRQARVTGDGRLPARAGSLLTSVLKDTPGHYEALRLLGAVYLVPAPVS